MIPRESLSLVLTTIIYGFSQFVINIMLPSTSPMTRILLSCCIDQFAMVLETLEIRRHQVEVVPVIQEAASRTEVLINELWK